MGLIFVDCEAWGGCPATGQLTEFGAVSYETMQTFHGVLVNAAPSIENSAIPMAGRRLQDIEMTPVFEDFNDWLLKQKGQVPGSGGSLLFISDNPAFDWQWINDGFYRTLGYNPFGHSARRIGDYYAGLVGDFRAASKWKKLRITKHTHHPVDDAMGNVEAFRRMQNGER